MTGYHPRDPPSILPDLFAGYQQYPLAIIRVDLGGVLLFANG